jgi:predicted component of type VI protein secretion system
MLVLPHHFQAAQANLVDAFNSSIDWLNPFAYGLRNLTINLDALANFEVRIPRLQARLKDGTLVSVPENAHLSTLDLKSAIQESNEGQRRPLSRERSDTLSGRRRRMGRS